MATFSANFNATVMQNMMKKVVDTVTKTNPFAGMMLTQAKEFNGRSMLKPVQISAPTTGGSFSGLDTFDTNKSNTKIQAEFDPRFYYQSIVAEGTEMVVSASDKNRSVDYLAELIEEGTNAMASGIGTQFYSDGTGNSNKDFLGLRAAVDDGTAVVTYGGISRTLYSSWQAYRNATGTALTSLDPIYTAINSTEQYSETLNKKAIFTTRALWSAIEGLMNPTVVSNVQSEGYKVITRNGTDVANRNGLKGEAGFNAIYLRGIPVVADDKCPTNYMYVLNMESIAWYGVQNMPDGYKSIKVGGNKEIEGYYSDTATKNIGAFHSDWIKPYNQFAEIMYIVLAGNLFTTAPNRHAVLIFS